MEELTNSIRLLKAYPLGEKLGSQLKPFRFKITNICGTGLDYSIHLEVLDIENRISSQNIAVKIDDENKVLLNTNQTDPTYQDENYKAIEAYKIFNGKLKPYENRTHAVRIWLDESAGNDTQNKDFLSKITIEANQNQEVFQNFSDYIISDTSKDLEVFNHESTEQTNSQIDYRYTGSNPNNYVCFGTEIIPCPEENLYRIVGVIPTQSNVDGTYENRVKLVKETPYKETESGYLNGGGYNFNKNADSNIWAQNPLQNFVLNGVYWNHLGDYQKYIDPSVWYLGAVNDNLYTTYTPNQYYTDERSNLRGYSNGNVNFVGNIGLLYASDIAYSLGLSYQDSVMYGNRNLYLTESYLGKNSTWLISPGKYVIHSKYYATEGIYLTSGYASTQCVYALNVLTNIYPTFFLKTNVYLEKGEGTKENPYRIGIED